MTRQPNPPKAHYPAGVYTLPVSKSPRTGSQPVPQKPGLVAPPNVKVFQENILLS